MQVVHICTNSEKYVHKSVDEHVGFPSPWVMTRPDSCNLFSLFILSVGSVAQKEKEKILNKNSFV